MLVERCFENVGLLDAEGDLFVGKRYALGRFEDIYGAGLVFSVERCVMASYSLSVSISSSKNSILTGFSAVMGKTSI